MNPFRKVADYFKDEEEREDRDALAAAIAREELRLFAETAYYPKFLAWLDAESAKPLDTVSDREMLVSAVRANTLRWVRAQLERAVAHARAAAEREE